MQANSVASMQTNSAATTTGSSNAAKQVSSAAHSATTSTGNASSSAQDQSLLLQTKSKSKSKSDAWASLKENEFSLKTGTLYGKWDFRQKLSYDRPNFSTFGQYQSRSGPQNDEGIMDSE